MGDPNSGKRARTRARLIEAAYDEIVESGFAGASLDRIAARAGMTKGAIYSNFTDKAQLFEAVRDAKRPFVRLPFQRGATFKQQMELLAESVIEDLPRSAADTKFITDYHRFAAADAELRNLLVRQYETLFAKGAEFFETYSGELAITPRQVAIIIQVLIVGLLNQSLLTPDEVSSDLIRTSFRTLAQGVTCTVRGRNRSGLAKRQPRKRRAERDGPKVS